MSNHRVLRAAERELSHWKNGGGVTAEISAHPYSAGLDDFEWRVSTAEVSQPGLFSHFAAVDRSLVVLTGCLQLNIEGRAAVLITPISPPCYFPGDARVYGTPVNGPVTDLNVMVRRGRYRAQVWTKCDQRTIDDRIAATLVFATRPCGPTIDGVTFDLQAQDCVQVEAAVTRFDSHFEGAAIVIEISELD